ncbi:MAG: LamG-like jellyroll fold domain-containing protein [Deltaproteobacteria bacterium]|nr:LamG-like jellyroll fold domain-containing protein [Deltaproteobacteria bacterium]
MELIGLWRPDRDVDDVVHDRGGLVPGESLHLNGPPLAVREPDGVIVDDSRSWRSDVSSGRLRTALRARALTLIVSFTPLDSQSGSSVLLSLGSVSASSVDDAEVDLQSALWIGALDDKAQVRLPLDDGNTLVVETGRAVVANERQTLVVRVDVDPTTDETRVRLRELDDPTEPFARSAAAPALNGNERLEIGSAARGRRPVVIHGLLAFARDLSDVDTVLAASFLAPGGPGNDVDGDGLPALRDGCDLIADAAQPLGSCARSGDRLQAQWTFDSVVGGLIPDVAGIAPPLPLTIIGGAAVDSGALRCTQDVDGATSESGDDARLTTAIEASDAFTFEVWLVAAPASQPPGTLGPGRILSITKDNNERNATLGQRDNAFELRMRTADPDTDTDNDGLLAAPVTGGVVTGALQHVVFSHRGSTTRLYLDGVAAFQTSDFGRALDNWNAGYDVAICNEQAGAIAPWHGSVLLAAIYDGALDAAEVVRHFELGPEGTVGVANGADLDHDAVVDALDSCDTLPNAALQDSGCPP